MGIGTGENLCSPAATEAKDESKLGYFRSIFNDYTLEAIDKFSGYVIRTVDSGKYLGKSMASYLQTRHLNQFGKFSTNIERQLASLVRNIPKSGQQVIRESVELGMGGLKVLNTVTPLLMFNEDRNNGKTIGANLAVSKIFSGAATVGVTVGAGLLFEASYENNWLRMRDGVNFLGHMIDNVIAPLNPDKRRR